MSEVAVPFLPHKFQRDVLSNIRKYRYSVLVCHRRFGKTTCMVYQLGRAAMTDKRPDARYVYLAPYLKQAKDIAWGMLKSQWGVVPRIKINESDLSLTFPAGQRVRLYGADNAESLRGGFFDGIVIDEMADIKPGVWEQIIYPALQDRKGWAIFIGTPKGMNQFHELFAMAQKSQDWFATIYRADETQLPWLDADTLEQARLMMPEMAFRQEFLCDFSASCDNVLITIDMVSRACARSAPLGSADGLPKVLGVDVARFGGDRTVLMKRQGFVAFEPIVLQGLDNMEVVGCVTKVIADWSPDAVFIDAGRGEGVIDRLRQLGHAVIEVNFGGKPSVERYANKRAEMWDTMAGWVRESGVLPNNPALKTDISVPTYSYDASNRIVLESKDSIKDRGMPSPDIADALALTFAFPVTPKVSSFATAHRKTRHKAEYDPFAGASPKLPDNWG
jgi:hypothetical protein